MATVTVVTADRTLEIEAASITGGTVNAGGHLILTRHDGTEIDVGAVSGMRLYDGDSYEAVDAFSYIGTADPGAVADGSVWYDTDDAGPFASDTQKGLVELATSAETATGTDVTRAVTPAGLAALPGTRVQVVSGIAETAIPSAFPVGVSMQSVTSGSGWTPNGGFGTIVTHNISNNRCAQTFYSSAGGTSYPGMWTRLYNASDGGGGWTVWTQLPLMGTASADNDIVQRKAGVWTNRTPTQVLADLPASSATVSGRVELATNAETIAGTDAVRAVTPAGLASMTPRNDLGIYIPPGWGQFWKPKRNAAGTGLATIAAVGSSSTQGLYASNLLTTSFVGRIITSLQTTYGDGGSGYFSSSRTTLWQGASTPINAWAALSGNFATLTGADWAAGNPYGPSGVYMYTQTVGNTISFTFRGTKCRIYTISGAGRSNWSYAVDGGSTVNVTDSGTGGDTVQVTTTATLSAGTHTIVLTKAGSAGTTFGVHGVTGENATGVVVNNFGISGASSAYFAGSGFIDAYGIGRWSGGPDYPADLVIYAAGANDANAGVDPDSWAANLRVFLQGVKDGQNMSAVKALGTTDVLILMQHIGQYDTTNLKWQSYVAQARGIAESYGAALVNMWPLGRNSWNYWNSLGYWGNSAAAGGVSGQDSIHMSDAGHQAVANAIIPVLTS